MRARDFDRREFILEEWPAALESGEYRQTTGILFREDENAYCCLGVACRLLQQKNLLPYNKWKGISALPEKAIALLQIDEFGGFENETGIDLASLNDEGQTFGQIAAKIREIERKQAWDKVDKP